MLPEHLLSTTPVLGYYLVPDDRDPSKIIDYEYGGIALNDPSEGLLYQIWTLRLEKSITTGIGSVYLSAPNMEETLQFARPGISQISLAFDQNMHPFVAFVEPTGAMYWWWDSADSTQKFTALPAGSRSPRCCLDDKRPMQVSASDIILSYIRDNVLYFREQRDRFLIEYELATDVTLDLLRVGMSNVNRLQFTVGLIDDPPNPIGYRTTVLGRQRTTVDGSPRKIVGVYYD